MSKLVAACIAVAAFAACGSSGASKGTGPSGTNAPATNLATTRPAPRLYEGAFTVLADKTHGPELCTNVMTSLPPQCSGLAVGNWDWDAVAGEERVRGTTWGQYHVVGTYEPDGGFTLAKTPNSADGHEGADLPEPDFSPACDDPSGDPSQGVAAWEAATQSDGVPHDERIVTAWVTDPRDSAGGDEFVANLIVRPGAKEDIETRVRTSYRGLLCVVERDLPTEAELNAIQSEVTADASRKVLGVTGGWSDGQRGVVVADVWVATDALRDYAHRRWGDRVELHGVLRPVE
jgi:hypothetical protein